MKRLLLVLPFVLAACDSGVTTAPSESAAMAASTMSAKGDAGMCLAPIGSPRVMTPVSRGFDLLGYNRCAGIFRGPADGVDGTLDGKVWGDATYAKDHLVMKWNAEWDRGNLEGWIDPNGYAAWEDNEWNGKVPGGSGEVWHYKIVWVGACGALGTVLPDGGYCLWGQFEVIFSHGTSANEHFWETHARPAGYGN